ncbi:MAG: hypothetical protein LUP99_04780 [Methanomicrobiales archaeon]|nr:hypothetical protein [Methanomicrobiales archaeon]
MHGKREQLEQEKKVHDFLELRDRIQELMLYYPRDTTLNTLLETLEWSLHRMQKIPDKGSGKHSLVRGGE